MRKQLDEENLFVVNREGKAVRFDLELRENKFGKQFAIATERPDTEAALLSAREEVGQDLKAIEGIRLHDLTYCERDGTTPRVKTMTFREAPHLGPDRLEMKGEAQSLSDDSLRAMMETALPEIVHQAQDQENEPQREHEEPIRETPRPKVELEHER